MHRIIVLVAALAGLVLASSAQASSIQDLANMGYSTHRTTGVAECLAWNSVGAKDSARGFGAEADFGCVNSPGYAGAIDAFAAGHDERRFRYEHGTAAAARDTLVGKGYSVAVSYSTGTLHVTGGCNVNDSVAEGAAAAYAAAAVMAAPCPPETPTPDEPTTEDEPTTGTPPPAGEEEVITTPEDALAKLRADLEALAKRVTALEDANLASWNAWVDAVQRGFSAFDAALAARSAGLNAMYGIV